MSELQTAWMIPGAGGCEHPPWGGSQPRGLSVLSLEGLLIDGATSPRRVSGSRPPNPRTRRCPDEVCLDCRNDTGRAVHDALIDCEAGLKILDLGEGCS